MTTRFLAFDFETASYQSDSACSIGLVLVEGSRVVDQRHFLIRPPSSRFVFTYVHGITWKQVENEPLFSDLWPSIRPYFQDVDFVAAHNASFDRRVLESCCVRYGIEIPPVRFLCTVQLARQNLGISPANLPAVCKALGITLKHHDAMSDALACAQIVLEAAKRPTQAPTASQNKNQVHTDTQELLGLSF